MCHSNPLALQLSVLNDYFLPDAEPCVTPDCNTITNASVEACEEARLRLNKEEDDLEQAISGIVEVQVLTNPFYEGPHS